MYLGKRFLIACLLLCPSLAWAAYSCNPGGNEAHYAAPGGSGTGCTTGTPCSLNEALSQANNDDYVILKNGTYNQQLHTERDGLSGASPITICAENRLGAVISFPPAGSGWIESSSRDTVRILHDNITLKGLRIDGNLLSLHLIDVVGTPGDHLNNILIEYNRAHDSGSVGVHIIYVNGLIARHNTVDNLGVEFVGESFYVGSAVTNRPVRNAEMYNNILSRLADNVVDLKTDTGAIDFHHNIIEDDKQTYNGFNGDGILRSEGSHSPSSSMHDNIFRNNIASYALRLEDPDISTTNNVFYGPNGVQRFVSTFQHSGAIVRNNTLCNTITTGINSTSNWSPNDINQPQSVCDAEVDRIIGQPQLVSCNIGDVAPNVVSATWTDLAHPPLFGANNADFAVTYNGTGQSETGAVVTGTSTTQTTLSANATSGQTVALSVTPGAVENSAFIGGTLNGTNESDAVTCTNTVGDAVFVAPTDGGDCSSPAEACDVAEGLALAQNGFTVIFTNGIYGRFDTTKSGLTYQAQNQHQAIISHSSISTPAYAVGVGHSNTTIDGLRITCNETAGGAGQGCVRLLSTMGSGFTLRNSVIEKSAGALLDACASHFSNCDTILIEDNTLKDSGYASNSGAAIRIGQEQGSNMVSGVIIRRNTIQGVGCKQALVVNAGGLNVEAYYNIFEGQTLRPGCGGP